MQCGQPPFLQFLHLEGHLLIPIRELKVSAAAVLDEAVTQWDFKRETAMLNYHTGEKIWLRECG